MNSKELAAHFVEWQKKNYTEEGEIAALRCALSDAAHLCDQMSREIEAANPGRKRGSVSSIGAELAHVAKRCGDAIWAMRKAIDGEDT